MKGSQLCSSILQTEAATADWGILSHSTPQAKQSNCHSIYYDLKQNFLLGQITWLSAISPHTNLRDHNRTHTANIHIFLSTVAKKHSALPFCYHWQHSPTCLQFLFCFVLQMDHLLVAIIFQ